MRGSLARRTQWLLLSDLHFKHNDLDRVRHTSQWIVAEAKRNEVGRAVICGDLLTSRTMQSTHVLSACYRFISQLSDVVPQVHILLGNHDLAYRRDYQTTALDALNIKRLAPYVSLHSAVAECEWDGRHVSLLPFREEQSELTAAVAALDRCKASKTVAFGHLAINKAITQRYVVSPDVDKPLETTSVTYRGFTGPDRFASLARTFTGHFHSHQTILQKQNSTTTDALKGSITYLGSPLQLNWGDLYDDQRGVVLFDPATLDHKLLINPHAVGYTTADLQQVLDGEVDEGAVKDKHVMLLGKLTSFKYATARDKLLSLGVRSVRNWTPIGFALYASHQSHGGLGASVPESDAAVQHLEPEDSAKNEMNQAKISESISDGNLGTETQVERLDLAAGAREFVDSLVLDESLVLRREELIRVGQRMIRAAREGASQEESEVKVDYQGFLDQSSSDSGTRAATELSGQTAHVFTAEPRKLTTTNFLGVQNTITIDFQKDIPRGLTLLVGSNGSGKSTLVEAMVWVSFGRCIRDGVAVNDVVNDVVRKNCSVKLEFANGYAITRYRKHKTHNNRVVVSLHGEEQPQYEHPDARTTQAGINELLGIDYETYVMTVVLSHGGAASFLTSTPAQRRDLIQALLGLSVLDTCGQISRLALRDMDNNLNHVKSKLEGLIEKMEDRKQRLKGLERTLQRIENEAQNAVRSLEAATKTQQMSAASNEKVDTTPEPSTDPQVEISALKSRIQTEQENLQQLKSSHAEMQRQKLAASITWLGWVQRKLTQLSKSLDIMAEARPTGLDKLFHGMKSSIVSVLLTGARSLLALFGFSSDNKELDVAINRLSQDIDESTSRLQSLEDQEKSAINRALVISEQRARAIRAQEIQARNLRACESLKQRVTSKQGEAATYSHLIETEQSSLHSLGSEHETLAAKLQELAADRELFVFWSSALTKRTRPASSSSPSAKSAAKATTANFREHIFVKSLPELNTLLAQILTVLYNDTRHARLAPGMLRSLLDSENTGSGSVLDRNLGVHPSLAYGKRSSGERKRIDLALFFALLQLARARSAHRAHYVLVDEVFDSLDEAGQRAVVRWCEAMTQTTLVGWAVVITHSQFLVDRDYSKVEDASRVLVVKARMGGEGTELLVNGQRIGVGKD
ncbi:P-loop-containing protein [Cladorrhinum sp. PSN259]|nr:P-loop-containing protein [Cladorrhinum sp. PSN259]